MKVFYDGRDRRFSHDSRPLCEFHRVHVAYVVIRNRRCRRPAAAGYPYFVVSEEHVYFGAGLTLTPEPPESDLADRLGAMRLHSDGEEQQVAGLDIKVIQTRYAAAHGEGQSDASLLVRPAHDTHLSKTKKQSRERTMFIILSPFLPHQV